MTLLSPADVRAHLRAVQVEPRTNWPIIGGVVWRPFCSNRQCDCFLPDVVACAEYSDGDDGEGLQRCGCCGWPEHRHPGPQRIQLRRTRGWRKPDGAVVVARPSKWGNPVRLGIPVSVGPDWRDGGRQVSSTCPRTRADLVLFYRLGLRHGGLVVGEDFAPVALPSFDDIRRELAGRDLACWCPLEDADGRRVACHADVLIRVAAGGEP